MKKKIFLLLGLGLMVMGLTSCSQPKGLTKSEIAMDTVCTVTIYDEVDYSVLDEAFSLIDVWESEIKKLNAFSDSSVIRQNNFMTGIAPGKMEDEIFSLIESSKAYMKIIRKVI